MAFQPFGYTFEITSPLPPANAKAAIRSRKKRWFDAVNGARGWVAGPFICLWLSALDRDGPMLLGRISHHNLGTKVSGRAGSDLNGIFMFSLLISLMLFLTYKTIQTGQASGDLLLLYGGIFLVGGPLLYWFAHKDRRNAEPLARFIRDAISSQGQSLRSKFKGLAISPSISVIVSGEPREGTATSESIFDAVLATAPDDFVILGTADEHYIQTLAKDGGFIVEKREGGQNLHFKAVRFGNTDVGDSRFLFSFEEAMAALLAYASESPSPQFINWEKMDMSR